MLEIAHKLDSGESLDVTQDNKRESGGRLFDLTQDKTTEGGNHFIDVTQDNETELEQIKASQAKALALLQNAITPKSKGGSYAETIAVKNL